MNHFLAIFIGGGIGSIVRYALSLWLGKHSSGFPIGTFVANILSCIVLGLVWIYAEKHLKFDPTLKLMILTGFCGGFSTFSTFSVETFKLMEEGKLGLAFLYVILSVLACLSVFAVVFASNK